MSNEKNVPFSQRISEGTIVKLKSLFEAEKFKSYTDLFETLIERFVNPINNSLEIENLKDEIILKSESINELNETILILNSKISDHENYDVTQRSNISEVQSRIVLLETEIDQLHEKLKNSVYVGPFNMKVLEKVAERETKNRGRAWNKSQIVNCILDLRFVKGTLNGGFDSLPDHVINEIKKEVQ